MLARGEPPEPAPRRRRCSAPPRRSSSWRTDEHHRRRGHEARRLRPDRPRGHLPRDAQPRVRHRPGRRRHPEARAARRSRACRSSTRSPRRVSERGANTSMIFVPARFAAAAIEEAIDAGIETVIAITEGIPVLRHAADVYWKAKDGGRAPDRPELPRRALARQGERRDHPGAVLRRGLDRRRLEVGHADLPDRQRAEAGRRSATPRSSASAATRSSAPTSSTSSTLFEDDDETELIVMVGEIGGDAEERAAEYIAENGLEAGRRLHRRLHRAARQADGPRRRDHLRLLGHRRGEEGSARGEGRPRRPQPDRDRAARGRGDGRQGLAGRRGFRRLGGDGRRHDHLRPRRSERRHPARRGGARGCRDGARGRLGEGALLRQGPRPPGPLRVDRDRAARDRSRAGDGHQRLDGGGGAALPAPARAGRPRDRRAALLRPHAAAARRAGVELVPVPLEEDGIDVDALERELGERPGQARPRDPELPQPRRLHPLRGEAPAPRRARRRARLLDLRGRPLPADPLRRRGAADDALDRRRRRPGDPRLLVLEDGQPRRPRRLPRRARRRRSRRSPSAPTRPTSRRTCSPSRSSSSSAAPAASTANIEFVNGALRERRDALVEALGEHFPDAEFVVPEGGYFLWVDLADDDDTVAMLAAASDEGVAFVAGPDFLLEGGDTSLRFSFASVPPEQIGEGVRRLAAARERVRTGTPRLGRRPYMSRASVSARRPSERRARGGSFQHGPIVLCRPNQSTKARQAGPRSPCSFTCR